MAVLCAHERLQKPKRGRAEGRAVPRYHLILQAKTTCQITLTLSERESLKITHHTVITPQHCGPGERGREGEREREREKIIVKEKVRPKDTKQAEGKRKIKQKRESEKEREREHR